MFQHAKYIRLNLSVNLNMLVDASWLEPKNRVFKQTKNCLFGLYHVLSAISICSIYSFLSAANLYKRHLDSGKFALIM